MAGRDTRTVLITGATNGIGAATAARLAKAGFTVFGTSRNATAAPPAPSVRMQRMDVRDTASVEACVASVLEEAGRLDVVVNNAGYGIAGSVEDTPVEDMMAQLDTNFLGVLRVCRAVIPRMRAQGSGRIIQISSLAARIGIPFQGAYSASKSALKGMSEALSIELAPYGIHVSMIEPGDTKTGFTAARVWTKSAEENEAYRSRARHAIRVMEKSEQAGTPADKVAALVEEAIRAEKPKLRYVSASSTEKTALMLQRILPGRSFEALIASTYEPKKKPG